MRVTAGILSLILLAGCGSSSQRAAQEAAQDRYVAAFSEVHAAADNCNQKFQKLQSTAVARARCLGEATAPLRPFVAFPDLYDQETAGRNMLAERWQTGKISQAEYEAQFAQMHSQIASEEQRRQLAGRTVNAQEMAAAAALYSTGPVVCNRVGTSTICN